MSASNPNRFGLPDGPSRPAVRPAARIVLLDELIEARIDAGLPTIALVFAVCGHKFPVSDRGSDWNREREHHRHGPIFD